MAADDETVLALNDDQVEARLRALAARESGNRNVPNEQGPGGTPLSSASGPWQIIDSTWGEGMGLAGVKGSWAHAQDAPPEVQHDVAKALYLKYGERPWAASAGSGVKAVATDTTDTTTAPPASGLDMTTINQVMQMLNGPQQQRAQPGNQSFVSLLGSALGGGAGGSVDMTPEQQEAAGRRSLLSFGMNLLANSGYSTTPKTLGQILASGIGGAAETMQGSEAQASALTAAGQTNRRENLAKALTYLTGQQANRIQQGQLDVSRGKLGVEKGQLTVQQAEEKRKQAETDLTIQRQKQLLESPPIIGAPPPAAAPPASTTVPTPPPGAGPPPAPSQQGDVTPAPGPVQMAGSEASTTSGVVPPMPGTEGDVAAILGGIKNAQAGGPSGGGLVAGPGAPGTSPNDAAPTWYRPTPPPQAVLDAAKGTLTPEQTQAWAQAERAARATGDGAKVAEVVKNWQDAVSKAQQDGQKALLEFTAKDREQQYESFKSSRHPATPTELEAGGIKPEPGVYYESDNFGNLTPKQIPVDPRLAKIAEADQERYQKQYAAPYDGIVKLRAPMEQMDALDARMRANGGFSSAGGITGDIARKIETTLAGAGLAPLGMREGLSDATAYQALASQVVSALKANISLGNVSDKDLEFVREQAPTLSQTPEGRQKLSGMLKQLWNHQEQTYQAATDAVHDRSTGYSLGGLRDRLAKLPAPIPTAPPASADAATHQQWVKDNKLSKGMIYYNEKGEPKIFGSNL